jgi:protein gp37
MAENSKIEWCDHTFNPWIGCQKVSPGRDHCYAEAMMDKRLKSADLSSKTGVAALVREFRSAIAAVPDYSCFHAR